MNDLSRNDEAILVIMYKFFYRALTQEEIQLEVQKSGILDMSHNEFQDFVSNLKLERESMYRFFDRDPETWRVEDDSRL